MSKIEFFYANNKLLFVFPKIKLDLIRGIEGGGLLLFGRFICTPSPWRHLSGVGIIEFPNDRKKNGRDFKASPVQ